MAVNSNFNTQSASTPVLGGYAQPSSGITEAIVTPADTAGNSYATTNAASGLANLQTANFRDSLVTVQVTNKASAPSAGGTVCTITPGSAGLWEISGATWVTGTVAAATDSNNMALNQTATARYSPIPLTITSTTASTGPVSFISVVLSLSAVDTVNVTAIGASTASSVYQATLVARRVG